jgi:hypothetical protein
MNDVKNDKKTLESVREEIAALQDKERYLLAQAERNDLPELGTVIWDRWKSGYWRFEIAGMYSDGLIRLKPLWSYRFYQESVKTLAAAGEPPVELRGQPGSTDMNDRYIGIASQ